MRSGAAQLQKYKTISHCVHGRVTLICSILLRPKVNTDVCTSILRNSFSRRLLVEK